MAIGLGTPEFWAAHPIIHDAALWGSIGAMVVGLVVLLIALAAFSLLILDHKFSDTKAAAIEPPPPTFNPIAVDLAKWRAELAALGSAGVTLGNQSFSLKALDEAAEWDGRCSAWRGEVIAKVSERDPIRAESVRKLRPYSPQRYGQTYLSWEHAKTEEMIWEVIGIIDEITGQPPRARPQMLTSGTFMNTITPSFPPLTASGGATDLVNDVVTTNQIVGMSSPFPVTANVSGSPQRWFLSTSSAAPLRLGEPPAAARGGDVNIVGGTFKAGDGGAEGPGGDLNIKAGDG